MNKINNSEINKFNEWACGCDLKNDYICGDIYNKRKHIICNECLFGLTVRKAKIKSLYEEMKRIKEDRVLAEKALHFGFVKMNEVLTQRIVELENGRD